MVRRLIQQQQRRLLQQQLGQCDPHLPTAGKLLRAALPILFAESQTAQHGAHLRIQRVNVVHMQQVPYFGEPIRSSGVLL